MMRNLIQAMLACTMALLPIMSALNLILLSGDISSFLKGLVKALNICIPSELQPNDTSEMIFNFLLLAIEVY